MPNLQVDGVTIELDSELVPLVKNWIEKRDGEIEKKTIEQQEIVEKINELTKRYEVLKADSEKIAGEKEQLTKQIEEQKAHFEKEFNQRLDSRRKLDRMITPFYQAEELEKLDGLTEREVKIDFLCKFGKYKQEELQNRTDGTIEGMFEVCYSYAQNNSPIEKKDSFESNKKMFTHIDGYAQGNYVNSSNVLVDIINDRNDLAYKGSFENATT